MSLQSDIKVEVSKFRRDAVPEAADVFNTELMALTKGQPRWYETGAPMYREMRFHGQTAYPKPVPVLGASTFSIPSREDGRSIPCRIIRPDGRAPVTGVFMYIHGGGWVLGDEKYHDPLLKYIADGAKLVTISIGYRRAPEAPFPAGPEDCYDAAEWLIRHAARELGGPLKFIGGESAGAHLSVLTVLHLLTHHNSTYAHFRLKGLVLQAGIFDLSKTPSVSTFKKPSVLVLDEEIVDHFLDAFLPDTPQAARKDPSISPLYFNFSSLAPNTVLPPALLICGTEDCLLDDTLFMGVKWQVAGGEAVVKIFPGVPHGFMNFPPEIPGVKEAKECVNAFLRERM